MLRKRAILSVVGGIGLGAVAMTGLATAAGQAAKPQELPKATVEKATLLIVCRVWAKMNVQVFETNTDYWKTFYGKAWDRLVSLGIPEGNIGPAQEEIGKSINADIRDDVALYLNYLTLDMTKQAAEYRAAKLGSFDKDCPPALN